MQVYDQVSRTLILETLVGTYRVQAIAMQRSVLSLCYCLQAGPAAVGTGCHPPSWEPQFTPSSLSYPAKSLKRAVSCCSQISC